MRVVIEVFFQSIEILLLSLSTLFAILLRYRIFNRPLRIQPDVDHQPDYD